MPKVSAEHKQEVRQRLLNATWEVIEREGPEGTTTRAILEQAGMSTGALYSYFPSKGDLFTALAAWQVDERKTSAARVEPAELNDRLADVEDDVSSLIRFVVEMFAEPDESPAFVWFRSRTDDDVRPALVKISQSMVDQFAPQVRTAQTVAVMDPVYDSEALIELFDILVLGMNQRHFTEGFVTSFERVGQVAVAILMKGVLQMGQTASDSTETGGTGGGRKGEG